MRECNPHVFLVGETGLITSGIHEYFDYKNKTTGLNKPPINWNPTTTNDIELLIEFFGRGCYESWDAQSTSNKNISRIRTDSTAYLQNIISSGHGSVLEHAMVNFKLADVSRIFTHELVRHRVGIAASQLSNRYYRGDEYGMVSIKEQIIGPSAIMTIEDDVASEVVRVIYETVENIEGGVKKISDILEIDGGKINFDVKKKLTSFIRRISPDGQATDLGWSTNMRTIRHVLESRTNRHAEWEMRYVFGKIGNIVMERYPALFVDYNTELIDGMMEFTTPNSKV